MKSRGGNVTDRLTIRQTINVCCYVTAAFLTELLSAWAAIFLVSASHGNFKRLHVGPERYG